MCLAISKLLILDFEDMTTARFAIAPVALTVALSCKKVKAHTEISDSKANS